jgi:hypothetical protein
MNQSFATKYLWALTERARQDLQSLVEAGLDPDLALVTLEKILPESEMYQFDESTNE